MGTVNTNALTIAAMVYWSISALWAGFRGMIRTVLSFLVIALTIFITYIGTPVVYQSLHGSANINGYMQERASIVVTSLAENVAAGTDSTGWLEILPLPQELKAVVAVGDNQMIAQIIRSKEVNGFLSQQLANIILRIASVALTALLTFIVLTILRIVLLKMADFPGISAMDHFFGFILGLGKGLVVIWIVLFVIRLISLTGKIPGAVEQIQESDVLSLLDHYNMVRVIIMSFITSGT